MKSSNGLGDYNPRSYRRGPALAGNTQPALAALDRALALARESKDEVAGPLRIVGPKSSFAAVLMPLLEEFCRKHPDI
jgi:DNA-binding transcriptional LysR family regulator